MHLHFIAIGGAIMHQLAIALHKKGYTITGSDDEINNPAKSNLEKEGLLPEKNGWYPEKINQSIDGIILGMHAKEDNPELNAAQELGIPIYSFPEYMYQVTKDKKRVVIAGSHGKTTTTSMIMHVLRAVGLDFDYLVGAKVEGFENSVRITDAPVIILEGDEYPASIIEKRPKIHFYHPHISVLTGISWDHVNVFPTYENYKEQFAIFLKMLAQDSVLIYSAEDSEVVKLTEQDARHLQQIPYVAPNYKIHNGDVVIETSEGNFALQIFGAHNLQNMEAAHKVCQQLGVSDKDFYNAITTFSGAANRLQKISDNEKMLVFRDFAHSPSKLKATLNAALEKYKNYNIIACFELHTFSSLTANFLSEYAFSMNDCKNAAVFFSKHALSLKRLPALDPKEINDYFQDDNLQVFDDKNNLRNWIENCIHSSEQPVCILLMSSGTFDGMDINFG